MTASTCTTVLVELAAPPFIPHIVPLLDYTSTVSVDPNEVTTLKVLYATAGYHCNQVYRSPYEVEPIPRNM